MPATREKTPSRKTTTKASKTSTTSKAKTTKVSRTSAKGRSTKTKRRSRTQDNPFVSREGAEPFIAEAFNAFRLDHEAQRRILEENLAELQEEIQRYTKAKERIPTALIEARTAVLAGLKTLNSNFAKFLMDLMSKKQLLSALDPPKVEKEDLTINFVLPDFGQVTVVQTAARPNDTDENANSDLGR